MKTIPNEGLIHFRDLLNRSYLLATNHQALLDIMSTRTYDFEKPWRARDFLARIIGFGLILSEGDAHKKQRKALNPAFNIKNIRALYGLMWEKTGLLLDEVEKEIMKQNPMQGIGPENGSGKIEMSVWARCVFLSSPLEDIPRLRSPVVLPLILLALLQWDGTSAPSKTPRTKLPIASWPSSNPPRRRWPSWP